MRCRILLITFGDIFVATIISTVLILIVKELLVVHLHCLFFTASNKSNIKFMDIFIFICFVDIRNSVKGKIFFLPYGRLICEPSVCCYFCTIYAAAKVCLLIYICAYICVLRTVVSWPSIVGDCTAQQQKDLSSRSTYGYWKKAQVLPRLS